MRASWFQAAVAIILVTTAVSQQCPLSFIQLGQLCYKFSLTSASHAEAAAACSRLNSTLAQPRDAQQQHLVTDWLRRHGFRRVSYWTALQFDRRAGRFVWDDGAAVGYAAWARSYPKFPLAKPCVTLSHDDALKWRNNECEARNTYVCQHESLSSPRQARIIDRFSCVGKYGYYAHPTDCTRYVLCLHARRRVLKCSAGMAFDTARTRCTPDALCVTTTTTAAAPVTQTPDPDFYDAGHDNTATRPTTITENIDTDFSHLRCNGSYVKVRDRCYKVYREFAQWNDARRGCQHDGARLATIKSADTTRFLLGQLRGESVNVQGHYIGAFWVGLDDQDVSERYVWSDGAVLDEEEYENWAKKARKRHKEMKKCVKLSQAYRYKWIDALCSQENGFICEREATDPRLKPPPAGCGWTGPTLAAVVGGHDASKAHHPWQVSLRRDGTHTCGASLIDACWVLTAAHCVTPPHVETGEEPTHALLGDYDTRLREDSEVMIRVAKIHVHPDWEAYPVPTNDIALIRLATCSTRYVPVCLPDSYDAHRQVDTVCTVTGYGTTDPGKTRYPDVLQQAQVPLIDRKLCERLYASRKPPSSATYITQGMFCAGYREGKIDACQGDSGGPLTCVNRATKRRVQLGVVSWGAGCARRKKPGVYSNVAKFRPWLRNVTNIGF